MYNTSHPHLHPQHHQQQQQQQQQSHSHQSRSPIDWKEAGPTPPSHPSQQPPHSPQHYGASSLYPHPAISQQPPTPTNLYNPSAHQQPITSSPSQTNDLLNPSGQRLRSGSGSLVASDIHSNPQDLRRSSSLNDAMSNPQAGYYQMASPMGSYSQHQMYSQASMPQSSYYQQPLPQLSVPISSSYMDQPRQQPMNRPLSGAYDYSQQSVYSSPSAGYPQSQPQSYPSSYASANSMLAPSPGSSYSNPVGMSPGSYMAQRPSSPATLSGAPVHVVDRQKKPQCWDHGCNGREFSTFSNLLRHQREKSGTAAKSYCPHCGAEFTRTTARNGHMEHGKCKTRRPQPGGSQ